MLTDWVVAMLPRAIVLLGTEAEVSVEDAQNVKSGALGSQPVMQELGICSPHATALSLGFPYLLTGYREGRIKAGECVELPSTMSGSSHISSGYLELRMPGVGGPSPLQTAQKVRQTLSASNQNKPQRPRYQVKGQQLLRISDHRCSGRITMEDSGIPDQVLLLPHTFPDP